MIYYKSKQILKVLIKGIAAKVYTIGTAIATSILALLKQRVLDDGGTFVEGAEITNDLDWNLIVTPNGYNAGKLYSAVAKTKIVDRNSTATYVDASGTVRTAAVNELRYNPDGSELLEGEATNYVKYSENISDAYWRIRGTTIITSGQTSPKGDTSAYSIDGIAGPGNDFFAQSDVTSSDFIFSLWIKKKTVSGILRVQNSTGTSKGSINIDFSLLNDSWNRVYAGHPAVTLVNPASSLDSSDGLHFFRASGTEVLNFDIWGIQVEHSVVTSYIPTNGSTVTRLADGAISEIDVDGDFTVERNSEATYLGADGLIKTAAANVPRIDFSTGELMLLVEGQSTNLWHHSSNLSNWVFLSSTAIQSNVNSPYNSLSYIFNDGLENNRHQCYINGIDVTAGKSYTISIFAKALNHKWIQLCPVGSEFDVEFWANFNLETGTIGKKGTATTATIEPYLDGWYRISITGNATTTGNSFARGCLSINNIDSGRYPAYTGTNSDCFYISDFQFEEGSKATSYIPTAGSTVTRLGDKLTGISNEYLYRNFQGTIFCEAIINDKTLDLFNINSGVLDFYHLKYVSSSLSFEVRSRSSEFGNTSLRIPVNSVQLGRVRLGLRFLNGLVTLVINGTVYQDMDLTTPKNLNNIWIGYGYHNTSDNSIKSLNYTSELLTDQQLIDLTAL